MVAHHMATKDTIKGTTDSQTSSATTTSLARATNKQATTRAGANGEDVGLTGDFVN